MENTTKESSSTVDLRLVPVTLKSKFALFRKFFGFSSVTRPGRLRSVSKCQKSILRAILRRNTCPGRLLTLPESNFREK